jgi:hypothetical protein
MATTKQPGKRSSAAHTTHARAKRDIDAVERVSASLEEVQKVVATMRGDVQAGAHRVVDDVERW